MFYALLIAPEGIEISTQFRLVKPFHRPLNRTMRNWNAILSIALKNLCYSPFYSIGSWILLFYSIREFSCPQTNKRCCKLYSIGGYFLHREAFSGCMYETQTQSKKYRQLDKTFGAYFKIDNLYSELYKKNFKKYYAGKPTKRYLRIMEQIQKAESIPYHEIERLMLRWTPNPKSKFTVCI